MSSLTDLPAWQALSGHAARLQQPDFKLNQLFTSNQERFRQFSLELDGLLLDYSRHFLDADTRASLLDLAAQRQLEDAIAAMFRGDAINNTEDRPALHVALRQPAAVSQHPEVIATLQRMEDFVDAVHNGDWRGHSGKPITAVVNLGIGGSDLGPAMVSEALGRFARSELEVRFVSNVDPVHFQRTVADLDPESTLFIIASKSFTTLETHQNAAAARRWFLAAGNDEAGIARHFAAITTNLEAAAEFGIPEANLFPMWDWVGGRYSLWSAIGLPIAMALGMDNFRQLLAGAHAMDEHFRQAPLGENMPVVMALLTVWYTGFFRAHSTAVVPYYQTLAQFPSYLQQLYMESLGKRVDRDGNPIDWTSGEVVWGTTGTNGQHSYFQLFHQGTEFIPVDFIAVAKPGVAGADEAHQHLLANCLSQSLALMQGTPQESNPHKQVPGNRPSTTLLLADLDPYRLGMLIALYEHKVYAQSVIWDINAFDQWGVELGKRLSKTLFTALTDSTQRTALDASASGLINTIDNWKH
ncbi:MAG: glucose-6-phosphate isomerase [Pseudohongiellaceae bacterium]